MGGPVPMRGHALSNINLKNFMDEINKDETISDVTKRELLASLPGLEKEGVGPGGFASAEDTASFGRQVNEGIAKARKTLEEARQGTDAKYKVRQIGQRQANLSADRPGLLQTRGGRR